MKILFSNLGYLRDINGTLWHHISRITRNVYCPLPSQISAMEQFKTILKAEQPDLCCIVEIDRGSFSSAYYNQIQALMDDDYRFVDVADKYGEGNPIGRMPLHKGKSNAFLSKADLPFQKLYFTHGSKRLIYRVELPDNITLYFAHFSLNKKVRAKQFEEINSIVKTHDSEVIILADFNIMQGFGELTPLLTGTNLKVLNREDEFTFRFHKRHLTLDLCICSETLTQRTNLKVIPQPFSDHAALLLEL